jgi:hypothetical protein
LKLLPHHRAGAKVLANQAQQALVAHLGGHPGHQDVVVDVVEKFRQVEVHRDAIAGLHQSLYLSQGSMGVGDGSNLTRGAG